MAVEECDQLPPSQLDHANILNEASRCCVAKYDDPSVSAASCGYEAGAAEHAQRG
jgi:hypothetical protein